MKICFLTKTLNTDCGLGRYSREVIERINKKKEFEIIVLTEEPSDFPLAKPVLNNSLNNIFFIFINALKIRKYIRQSDIIHCLDAYPYGVIGALANLGLKRKFVISVVGSYSLAPLEQKIKGLLLRWAYRKADCVLSISSFIQKEVLKRVRIKNAQVVNLGIDFDKFQIGDFINNRESKREKVILSVGELKRRKGYHISIPAMVEVKKKYPGFKYYIVGHQDNRLFFLKLKKLAKKLNLDNNIVFLEKISDRDLIKLYHQSDLFLLTSVNIGLHCEGFGLVYLEANACGKPVIGTYNCGAEDIITNGYNGFLVPQNDIKKTSQAILEILDDSQLARQMGENGIKKAREMSWQKTIEKYIEVYRKIELL